MNKWYYRGREVTEQDVPEGAVGFIYKISMFDSIHNKNITLETCSEGLPDDSDGAKYYVGKKMLTSTRKTTVGKREQAKQLLETGDKRKVKKVQKVTKNSNWMTYNSSCKALQEDVKSNPELCYKEILTWCYSKLQLTYEEVRMQMILDVLHRDTYNDNILGKFHRGRV